MMKKFQGKNYEIYTSGEITIINFKGPLIVNEDFQNEMDRGIASVAGSVKIKLLVITEGAYSIDPALREKMAIPGTQSSVCAVAFFNKDADWNEINQYQVSKKSPPFLIRFFSDRESAEEWLRSVKC